MNTSVGDAKAEGNASRTLEKGAPQVLSKPWGRDLLFLVSLILQHDHIPVLALDEEGTLELEARLGPKEILLLSVTSEGMTDALVHNAGGGCEAIASKDVGGVTRFLLEWWKSRAWKLCPTCGHPSG